LKDGVSENSAPANAGGIGAEGEIKLMIAVSAVDLDRLF